MKYVFFILLIIGCSSEVVQPVPDDAGDASIADVEERQTYPTPSKSENTHESGCISVIYIAGEKYVFPCAGRDFPHGPIYENK